MSWIPGIVAAIGDEYEVRGIGFGNCPFGNISVTVALAPNDGPRCDVVHKTIYKSISEIGPDLLIVSDVEAGIDRTGMVGEAVQTTWATGYTDALTRVTVESVVVLSPPPVAVAPDVCATPRSLPGDCVSELRGGWKMKARIEGASAAQAGAKFVDTSEWFCSGDSCPMFAAGMIIRTDGMHLTAQYSTSLAPELRAALEPADHE